MKDKTCAGIVVAPFNVEVLSVELQEQEVRPLFSQAIYITYVAFFALNKIRLK
jgi:hypothetical protein